MKGAGTGKTTTVIHYARALIDKGHEHILYLTFSRNAAQDAQNRFNSKSVETRTLHSAAFKNVGIDMNKKSLLGDHELEKFIKQRFSDEIDRFMCLLPQNEMLRRKTAQKVAFFIRKTLQTFLQSKYSLDEWIPDNKWSMAARGWSIYFPAKKYHNTCYKQFGIRFGCNYDAFYAARVKELYKLLSDPSEKVTTYDTVMKQAQLSKVHLPYTAVLVDESQDLNACQIDWITLQRSLYGSHIFLVGDPAQSIYSFRGAKSVLLLELENCEDKFLTVTHRFSSRLANVANTMLYCKEHSPQTNYKKTWIPYRLQGGSPVTGRVTSESLLDDLMTRKLNSSSNNKSPLTLLAHSNVELLEFCVKNLLCTVSDSGGIISDLKIALNGEGEMSGKGAWKTIQRKIHAFYNIYMGKSSKLNYYPWNIDVKDKVDWKTVEEDIETYELTDCMKIARIINQYQCSALEVFDNFARQVIDPAYDATSTDVDIILSTIHGAKGMEWDNVQLLAPSRNALNRYKVKENRGVPFVEMDYKCYGDDINLWYVALTRAKKVLSVPSDFMELLRDFEYFLKGQYHSRDYKSFEASPSKRVKLENTGENEASDDLTESSPRRFIVNGTEYRTMSDNEMTNVEKHLALPWAEEMNSSDGGLFINQENMLDTKSGEEQLNEDNCDSGSQSDSVSFNPSEQLSVEFYTPNATISKSSITQSLSPHDAGEIIMSL